MDNGQIHERKLHKTFILFNGEIVRILKREFRIYPQYTRRCLSNDEHQKNIYQRRNRRKCSDGQIFSAHYGGNVVRMETQKDIGKISEEKIKEILSKTCENVRKYIQDHPEIIYKGVPLLIALYILSPVLFFTWEWLPWIWASYELYNRIPCGTLPCLMQISRLYVNNN